MRRRVLSVVVAGALGVLSLPATAPATEIVGQTGPPATPSCPQGHPIGLRQRFVHDLHTAHLTEIMGEGVFPKPLGPALV